MAAHADNRDLILASASPRRRALLARLQRPFRVVTPQVEEPFRETANPEQTAMMLAQAKARQVASGLSGALVIAADTVVAAGGLLIGKPADSDEARRILKKLSGTRHAVITAVCVLDTASGREATSAERTWITMRPMSEQEIDEYVASGEPMGKAGAYAIQERGDRYVAKIEGSFSNVVGLPLELVTKMLRRVETRATALGPRPRATGSGTLGKHSTKGQQA